MKLELPRGMRDIEPDELFEIEYIRKKFVATAEKFNFSFMDPSPIEFLSTLEAKSGPAIINETYSFQDKGKRNIALRFDLTIGLARYVSMRRDLKLPSKIAAFGGVWRYDEPQMGRYRYFHQWDVEIFGSSSIEADAEVIEFVAIFLKNLGLDVIIEINHKGILEEYLKKKLDIVDEAVIGEMLRAIDKMSKKTKEEILIEYSGKLDRNKLELMMEFSSFAGNPNEKILDETVKESSSWKNMIEILSSLKRRKLENVRINLGIVRGLDYYSGIVFEARDPSIGLGALVGGGRYDRLTDVFARPDIGATGAAGGIERIIIAMKEKKLKYKKEKLMIYVVYSSPHYKHEAIELISELRKDGYVMDYDINERTINKQLRDAAQKNAIIILILDDESRQDNITIRYKNRQKKIKKAELKDEINRLFI